jgi:hypothetical protein
MQSDETTRTNAESEVPAGTKLRGETPKAGQVLEGYTHENLRLVLVRSKTGIKRRKIVIGIDPMDITELRLHVEEERVKIDARAEHHARRRYVARHRLDFAYVVEYRTGIDERMQYRYRREAVLQKNREIPLIHS